MACGLRVQGRLAGWLDWLLGGVGGPIYRVQYDIKYDKGFLRPRLAAIAAIRLFLSWSCCWNNPEMTFSSDGPICQFHLVFSQTSDRELSSLTDIIFDSLQALLTL